MSWRSILHPFSRPCPLCGEKGTYKVRGHVDYDTLVTQLAGQAKWLRNHGLNERGGVPLPPDTPENRRFLAAVQHPPVTGDGDADGRSHTRCNRCATLLPPEFHPNDVTAEVAVTVAGSVGHGKTSWLVAILAPPDRSDYEIVRPSDDLQTNCYEYAEPYTFDILKSGFRSPLFYQLLGTTLVLRGTEFTFIRTVDIKGEMFAGIATQKPNDVIIRHLGSSAGSGWLLVVDQFAGATNPALSSATLNNIASAYESISVQMAREGANRQVRKAIVWTFLDQARWTNEAAQWLQKSTPAIAAQLSQIGETAQQPIASLTPFVDFVDGHQMEVLKSTLEKTADILDAPTLDGLIALLLRLQLLYTLRASNYIGTGGLGTKFDYLMDRGYAFVDDCQAIARQLYARDRRSAMHNYARREDWKVFPCARFDDTSVWADQILIEAVAGAR
jgi:hypothetical protein